MMNFQAPKAIRHISELSTHSYQLLQQLAQASQDATYGKDGDDIILHVSGDAVRVTPTQQLDRSNMRGVVSEHTADVIHDLMYDSLVHLNTTANIASSAPSFLSAFTPDARWKCTTASVDDPDGDIADHDESDPGMTPASVFLRYRFPLIRFEWRTFSPVCELRKLKPGDKYVLESSWTGWARLGTFDMSPLVARGSIRDTLEIIDGTPLISHRLFCIERITQPEYFKPQALSQNKGFEDLIDAELEKDGLYKYYAFFRAILHKIRSSQAFLASSSVVGFSAVLASLQPMVMQYSHVAAYIMAAMGTISAMMGMVAMVMTNVSKVVELANAAKGVVGKVDAEIGEGKLVEVMEGAQSLESLTGIRIDVGDIGGSGKRLASGLTGMFRSMSESSGAGDKVGSGSKSGDNNEEESAKNPTGESNLGETEVGRQV